MHLNIEFKDGRDTSLIQILAFPVAMLFIVYRYKNCIKYVSDVTAIILSSMGFVIDCVSARLRPNGGLHPKAHVIATHARWESRLYLLPMLQTAKIVYIDRTQ